MSAPSTSRRRLLALASLFLLPCLTIPQHTSAQISPDVVVHLTISGGFRYKGTLSSAFSGIDYFCATQRDTNRPGFSKYVVYYDVTGLLNAAKGNFKKNAFSLFVRGYKASITHYGDPNDLDISVIVHRHAYAGNVAISGYRMRIRIARNGLSGSFKGSHLTAMRGFRGKPVNVQGSWTCAQLLPAG